MRVAVGEIGVREVLGGFSNPRIIEYLQTVHAYGGDETPWCSAFVNWVMQKASYPATWKAYARSWLAYGERLDQPRYGAIVILWRDSPESWMGHVGFFVDRSGDRAIKILGGNQNNAVNVAAYPRYRVLGYRWPSV
jgi:uncharacterized protein (TIGR02594 family)